MSATEFTSDWAQFEVRLAGVLGKLAQSTQKAMLRLRYPTVHNSLGEVTLEGTSDGTASDIGLEGRGTASLIGVSVVLRGVGPHFYPLPAELEEIPEAANKVCDFLREDALVAHPSLLTADGDYVSTDLLDMLGLTSPAGVVREARESKQRTPRRLAKWDDPDLDVFTNRDEIAGKHWPELSWPRSVDEVHEAIDKILMLKYGSVELDTDDDFIIDTSAQGGTRFYLTVINDLPMILCRKAAVLHVNSRGAAVIEANYLNREVMDIRWVLRGYTLYQELGFPTAPFVPNRFVEMLDRFGLHYRDTVSALRLRLGEG